LGFTGRLNKLTFALMHGARPVIKLALTREVNWTPEVEKLGVKLLCGACYDYAKSMWSDGRKITQ
jgi:hypothetical protein